MERNEADDFGTSRTTLAGVIRRLVSRRSTYIILLLAVGVIVFWAVVLNATPSETITIHESGSSYSVYYVISGKTPFVVSTEKDY